MESTKYPVLLVHGMMVKDFSFWPAFRGITDFLRKQKLSDRRLFILRYFCSESLKDASNKVGLSESAAKSKLMRMRKALKKILEEEDIFI